MLFCFRCKGEFKITAKDIFTVPIDSEVEKTYFTCPHCGVEYVVFYTDAKIRQAIKKINEANQKGKHNLTELFLQRRVKMINKVTEMAKELKIKVEGGR